MKSNFLQKILETKKRRVESVKQKFDSIKWREKIIESRRSDVSFRLHNALQNSEKVNIIAEIKRASPSKGVINNDINIAETAVKYQHGGACAISVLTEEDFFKGSLDDLKTVRHAADLPILRKDFTFDEFQIFEAAEAGADAILLIAAMLDDKDVENLYRLAEQKLNLDALVEIHTLEELERAKKIGAKIIGINNRDLNSFNISLDVSRELVKHAPETSLLVAESGLKSPAEILELREIGFSGFLIGETLMQSENVFEELKKLTANNSKKNKLVC